MAKSLSRFLAAGALLVASWYLMMVVHEFGHVLHAWVSGGDVAKLNVPLTGYSRTELASNPRPSFVAWGGPVWGCLIPLGLLAVVHAMKFKYRKPFLFFAGFCLIANGAYIGVGSFMGGGDAGDLLRHGAHRAWLVAFGLVGMAAGLLVWHRLGPRFGL